MPRPIITLTTDFGTRDHFVAVMKAVILSIAPRVEIVDVTHEISPFAIPEAAFVVSQLYPYFPRRTVHVVVVDPGVGSERRPILVQAAGQFFVGPDNGVFSMIYAREPYKARHLTASRYFRPTVSRTFHGRDIFAPVAAHLRLGVAPSKFGKLIRDPLHSDFYRPLRTGKRSWSGTVLKVDRFGNLITNFTLEEFPALRERPFEMNVGLLTINRLVGSFAEAVPGELALMPGSSGYLEVVSNQESAARKLGCAAGSPVELIIR